MATWNSSDNFPGIYWISYLFTKLPSPTSTLCSNRRHTICSLTHLSSDTETDSREILNIYQLVSLRHNHTYISSTIHHDFRNRPHQPPNPPGYIRPSRGVLRDHPRTHLSAGTGAPEGNNSMVLKRAIFQKGHTSLILFTGSISAPADNKCILASARLIPKLTGTHASSCLLLRNWRSSKQASMTTMCVVVPQHQWLPISLAM